MKDVLFLVLAGVIGFTTFFLASRKFRADCVP